MQTFPLINEHPKKYIRRPRVRVVGLSLQNGEGFVRLLRVTRYQLYCGKQSHFD